MYALHLTHLEPSFLQDPPGAVGSFSAPGDQVNRPSRSRTDRRMFCFCMFFLLGFLLEETPCEHGENMQTPHRKAREIAHLPPRANSTPCGNQTHDLLAARRQCKQCKQLSHRATLSHTHTHTHTHTHRRTHTQT